MNKKLLTICLLSLSALAIQPAAGQESPPVQLSPPPSESADRYGLSFRMAFNISADFKTTFGPSAPIPGPGVHGVDRNYDDGFNRRDITWPNNGGYTAYWGYDYDSQYNHDLNNPAITMHSAAGTAVSKNCDDDPHLGFEASYNRTIGRKGKWQWGLELAFNYMNASICDDRQLSAGGTLTSDTYPTPGAYPPPPAGYPGDYYSSVGSPQLYDSPGNPPDFTDGRVMTPLSATVTGKRELDADVFGWRLGPYVGASLGSNVLVSVSAGLALAVISSDFKFNQTVSYYEPGSTTDKVSFPSRDSSSQSDVLVGGYVSGQVNVALSKTWGAFGGVQFQGLGHYDQSVGNSRARLDLSESLFAVLGVSCSF